MEKQKTPTISQIQNTFSNCYDFEEHRLDIGGWGKLEGCLFFIDGLVSGSTISESIIKPITDPARFEKSITPEKAAQMLIDGVVYGYTVHLRRELDKAVDDILSGFCAVFIKGFNGGCITFETKTDDKRGIDQPKEEKVVKGAKDAFIEIIKTNTMLVRRRLKNKDLKIEQIVLGDKTNTAVTILYLDNFTNPVLIDKVRRRLEEIPSAGIVTSSDIEESIIDCPDSPFPQLITTERPDKFCLNLIEGRVGILVDGLPIGYLAPGTFTQFFKVPEDKSNHFLTGTFLTALRYIALVITLVLPAFYVAVAMYHHEMIPTKLMQSIIESKQSVPFPTAVEVIGMLVSFELLQEAGLRLPNPIGETVSIIGALVVGQSAVEAKVVSPVVIIVVAMAGIAGYTMPNQDMGSALRICRFGLVLAAILFGMYGLALGLCLIIYHLCYIESFGIPYLTPFVGNEGKDIKKAFVREPALRRQERDTTLFKDEQGENK